MNSNKREVGSNFDKQKADDIFDSIPESSEKKMSDSQKKNMNLNKDVSALLNQAKSTDEKTAADIYKKILTIAPDNFEAYEGLSGIYQKTGDLESERKLLKSGIQNLTGNKKEILVKRLKEINL